MPILNYTTHIPVEKTVNEIQRKLAGKASQIAIDYGPDGTPIAISFFIEVNRNPVRFRLPCDTGNVLTLLRKDPKVSPKQRTEDHAARVAWRIIKDWLEAQVAIIEAGQAKMEEVFLPYALFPDGQTLFQHFAQGDIKMLTSGESTTVEGKVLEAKFGSD